MSYFHKYKFYKNKYKNLLAGSLTYGETYLDAIKNKNCQNIQKYENSFESTYKLVNSQDLYNRKLYLFSQNFNGKCKDFWTQITDLNLEKLIDIFSGSNEKSHENFLSNKDIKLIKENKFLLFKNIIIPNLWCLLLHKEINFLYILYTNQEEDEDVEEGETSRQDIICNIENKDKKTLPRDGSIFNISSNLSDSKVLECFLSSFYYEDLVSRQLKENIVKYLENHQESQFKEWNTWLLSSILSLLFDCLGCLKFNLEDQLTFDVLNKEGEFNCEYKALTYDSAKDQSGLFQSLGFRADPPIDYGNLKKIMELELPQKYQETIISPNDIYLKKKDKDEKTFYINIKSGKAVWYISNVKIINSLGELISLIQIKEYLDFIGDTDNVQILNLTLNKIAVESNYKKYKNKKVITIKDFQNWSWKYGVYFDFTKLILFLDPSQISQFNLLYNKMGICHECGNKIIPYGCLEPFSKVIMKTGENKDKLALTIDFISNCYESPNDKYLVTVIGENYGSETTSNDIQPLRCRLCRSYVRKKLTDYKGFNLISIENVETYINKYLNKLKQNYFYLKHPNVIEELEKRIFESFSSLSRLKIRIDNIRTPLLYYKDFIEWHLTFIYNNQTKKLVEELSDKVKEHLQSQVYSLPIDLNIFKEIRGEKETINLSNFMETRCLCPHCYNFNLNLIENINYLLRIRVNSQQNLRKLLLDEKENISRMMDLSYKFNIGDARIMIDYLKPNWDNLDESSYIKYNITGYFIIVLSDPGAKIICLIPRVTNYQLLNKNENIEWCPNKLCQYCDGPLNSTHKFKLPKTDGINHFGLTPVIRKVEGQLITVLPVQPKIKVYQMIEIRYPYKNILIYYSATIIGKRDIPREILGYYQACKHGPTSNKKSNTSDEFVSEYLVRFKDINLDCWVLLTNYVWRYLDINWEYYLLRKKKINTYALERDGPCLSCMANTSDDSLDDTSPELKIVSAYLVLEEDDNILGKSLQLDINWTFERVRQEMISNLSDNGYIKKINRSGIENGFVLIENLRFVILYKDGIRSILDKSRESNFGWLHFFKMNISENSDIYKIYMHEEIISTEGGKI